MAKLNRKCLCCSTRYSYCPSCSRADALLPTWHAEFCSEECMTLWQTATKYNMNKLTKSEAKGIISNLQLKPVSEYVTCVQRDLENILKEEPKPKRGKRIEVQPIDEFVGIIPTSIEKLCEVVKQENE
nr:MAG TPA: hypothetical protein [Caudoviricetes sp.]